MTRHATGVHAGRERWKYSERQVNNCWAYAGVKYAASEDTE